MLEIIYKNVKTTLLTMDTHGVAKTHYWNRTPYGKDLSGHVEPLGNGYKLDDFGDA